MHLAPRTTAAAALIVLALAGCGSVEPAVLVAEEVTSAAAEPSPPAAESSVQMYSGEAAQELEATVTDVGLIDTEQHDVAFGTVVNEDPRVAHVSVTVTTHNAKGEVLTQDATDVRAAGGTSTPFVLDIFPPAGATVDSIDAVHTVTAVEQDLDQPTVRVQSSTVHDDAINPLLTGTVVSTYPGERTAVPVTAICVGDDGEPVAAGHGRIPTLRAGSAARYEIMLFGSTPRECQVGVS